MEDFGSPTKENVEITREQVIKQIVTDPENPENGELIGKYIEGLQQRVDSNEISLLALSVEIAELYEQTARQNPYWNEAAADALYEAALLANQEGDEDLKNNLFNRITSFE